MKKETEFNENHPTLYVQCCVINFAMIYKSLCFENAKNQNDESVL